MTRQNPENNNLASILHDQLLTTHNPMFYLTYDLSDIEASFRDPTPVFSFSEQNAMFTFEYKRNECLSVLERLCSVFDDKVSTI